MAGELTRILSDVHYGDRASLVRTFTDLQPLFANVDAVVFNGDTLDTRPGPHPRHTAACRQEIAAVTRASGRRVTFLTGNHDPDFSTEHALDLANERVFALHGDVLFDDIVPWGRDAALIRRRLTDALGDLSPQRLAALPLAERLALWRSVAASIPQRHQSERNVLKYLLRFAVDTVWPPTRFLQIFRAWSREPHLATALVRAHRPAAQVVLLGHTHRPRFRQVDGGPLLINTGSFTAPFGGFAVDIDSRAVTVRRIERRRSQFVPGRVVGEFPLR